MDLASTQAACKALFASAFGGPADIVVAAPGRVNLIGEHTDYNEGYVMPFCIGRYTVVVARKVKGSTTCRVVSSNAGGGAVAQFPGDASLKPCARGAPDSWTNYMRGVVAQYLPLIAGQTCGFEAAVVSTVPLGGGLSSSASLEVATATMLEHLYALPSDPVAKALRCQQCEHTFCATPCGIMDQFVSACGMAGHALLIDCRKPYATEQVPLDDPDLALLVANSNVKHELSGSEYPDRVRQCQEACAALRKHGHPGVQFLRDATPQMLASLEGKVPDLTLRRARHGVTEDLRTLKAKAALQRGAYAEVGQCMLQSHNSLRDDYQVSTPELDALVDIAMSVDGVYGARMTGGGFGGCTVTLLKASALPRLLAAIDEQYPKRCQGQTATCFATTPHRGAMVLQQNEGVTPASRSTAALVLAAAAAAAVALLAAKAAARR
jgi:galactokinase